MAKYKWKGCPQCGHLQYRTQFQSVDRNGIPILGRYNKPVLIHKYADPIDEFDTSLKEERMINWCVKCGHEYDKREGRVLI